MAGPARILVIDDSPTIRRVVERALTAEGFSVSTANDGESGLQEARALRPDLVLLDFVMPGMNGYQVVKALAEDDSVDEAPILFMCTRSDQVPKDALAGLGVVGVVTKPFSPEDLLAKVRDTLDEHGRKAFEETAPILGLSALGASGEAVPMVTEPELFRPVLSGPPGAAESLDEDLAAAAALADLTRVLADALYARGIDDADSLSEAICNQVRAGLSTALLSELVRREVGVEVLRRPIPSLYGDLATVPLPEVLQLLKFQGQTGVLEVALDHARYEVAFRHGQVIGVRARNAVAGARLGRYFVEQGAVTDEELAPYLSARAHQGRPLGLRLLDDGKISQDQLERALGAQAHDLMFGMLRARSGVFGLRSGEDALPDVAGSPGFSVDELLFESLRRVDEATVFRKEVPSLESTFLRVRAATEEGLTGEEIAVFRLLDETATKSARLLMDTVGTQDHQIEKVLYRLVVLGRAQRAKDRG